MVGDEIILVGRMLPGMSGIANITEGEIFSMKDSSALLVLQRRLAESDLKKQLVVYNELFSNNRGLSLEEIKAGVKAYIGIKVLVDAGSVDFDGIVYRNLIKEYRSQIAKQTNIIRLSKANLLSAESFQREIIEKTIEKNEALIQMFEEQILNIEQLIARTPAYAATKEASVVAIDVLSEDDSNSSGNIEQNVQVKNKVNILSVLKEKYAKGKEQKEEQKLVTEHLRGVEIDRAQTSCKEIPYYEKSLMATEILPCKDMNAYCILKKKDNVYIGLRDDITGRTYNNSDQSLLELTEVTEEFVQFMTEDLLSGDYTLKPFDKGEKQAMHVYFDFVGNMFARNIGVTLSVSEYMAFKSYYNRLVDVCNELEREARKEYYRALPLIDEYLSYMDAYGLMYTDSKPKLLERLVKGEGEIFADDLQLLIGNHMVDKVSIEGLLEVIQSLRYFSEAPLEEKFVEEHDNDGRLVGFEDFSRLMIKMQCLDANEVLVDEAIYATGNIKTAVKEYLSRRAYVKRIGLLADTKEIYLYASRNGALSVPILTEQIKKIKGIDEGAEAQLVQFYEEQIKKLMIELSEGGR